MNADVNWISFKSAAALRYPLRLSKNQKYHVAKKKIRGIWEIGATCILQFQYECTKIGTYLQRDGDFPSYVYYKYTTEILLSRKHATWFSDSDPAQTIWWTLPAAVLALSCGITVHIIVFVWINFYKVMFIFSDSYKQNIFSKLL